MENARPDPLQGSAFPNVPPHPSRMRPISRQGFLASVLFGQFVECGKVFTFTNPITSNLTGYTQRLEIEQLQELRDRGHPFVLGVGLPEKTILRP